MAIQKVKFTSESASVTQTKINENFEELDLARVTNTSDLTNDGDGESPFATQAYVAENGGKIDSISVDNVAQTIDANKNVNIDLSSKQDASNNTGLNTTDKSIVGAINEVNSKAEGREKAISYASISLMVTGLNAMSATELKVGDNIFIQALDVPDLWVYSVESTSSTYAYTTDAAFVSAIDANGYVQIGYYKVSKLETEKVDLSAIDDIADNTTKIYATSGGGFAGGYQSQATSGGGAVGYQSQSTTGFAGGVSSYTTGGGAIGSTAGSVDGGAVGKQARAGDGFSGGKNAWAGQVNNAYIDTIQLGTGTNSTAKTLQVYDDNIYNANTHTLSATNIKLNGTDLATTLSGKQSSIAYYGFSDDDNRWSALTNGYYTLTISSALIPFACFNASGVQVMAELSYSGTKIYIKTDTKFAGHIYAF